jgi:hypothetical protein
VRLTGGRLSVYLSVHRGPGIAEAQRVMALVLGQFVFGDPAAEEVALQSAADSATSRRLAAAAAAGDDEFATLAFCNQLNVSACEPSVRLSKLGNGFRVIAYNPLGSPRTDAMRVPINPNGRDWAVTGDASPLPSWMPDFARLHRSGSSPSCDMCRHKAKAFLFCVSNVIRLTCGGLAVQHCKYRKQRIKALGNVLHGASCFK